MQNKEQPLNLIALLLSLGTVLFYSWYWWDFPIDDTFIHLVYAENLATGHGFAFNQGEPSYGMTSPSWVILLAFFGFIFGKANLYLISKLLGLFFSLAAILVFYFLAIKVFEGKNLYSLGSLITFSCGTWFNRWSVSGMETSLAVFLILLSVLTHLVEKEKKNMIFPLTPLFLILATITRPESFILFGLYLTDLAMSGLRSNWKKIILGGTEYGVLLFLWLMISYTLVHSFLPNSFSAKSSSFVPAKSLLAFIHILKLLAVSQPFAVLFFTLFFISCFIIRAGKDNIMELVHGLRRRLVFWAFPLAIILGYSIKGIHAWTRYQVIYTPFFIICGFLALGALLSWSRFSNSEKKIIPTVIALSFIYHAFFMVYVVKPHAIIYSRLRINILGELGNWLKKNTPEDSSFAATEIGLVKYLSKRNIVDISGLVNPEVLSLKADVLLNYKKPGFYVSQESFKGGLTQGASYTVSAVDLSMTNLRCDATSMVSYEINTAGPDSDPSDIVDLKDGSIPLNFKAKRNKFLVRKKDIPLEGDPAQCYTLYALEWSGRELE